MDETYIKVKGAWCYYYRAIDSDGETVDFYLSKRRDGAAAKRFFKRAIRRNGRPFRVNIDRSGANLFAIKKINQAVSLGNSIAIRQTKRLNQLIEQDHRFIKRITNPMMGFKTFVAAWATLKGIELCHMLRKRQSMVLHSLPSWRQFYALVG